MWIYTHENEKYKFPSLGAVSVALLITPLEQFNVNNNNKQRLTAICIYTQRRQRRQDNFVNNKKNNNNNNTKQLVCCEWKCVEWKKRKKKTNIHSTLFKWRNKYTWTVLDNETSPYATASSVQPAAPQIERVILLAVANHRISYFLCAANCVFQ
jgi:hypothetical protein